jgi:hypothetical protein
VSKTAKSDQIWRDGLGVEGKARGGRLLAGKQPTRHAAIGVQNRARIC